MGLSKTYAAINKQRVCINSRFFSNGSAVAWASSLFFPTTKVSRYTWGLGCINRISKSRRWRWFYRLIFHNGIRSDDLYFKLTVHNFRYGHLKKSLVSVGCISDQMFYCGWIFISIYFFSHIHDIVNDRMGVKRFDPCVECCRGDVVLNLHFIRISSHFS